MAKVHWWCTNISKTFHIECKFETFDEEAARRHAELAGHDVTSALGEWILGEVDD